jgi:hypothetical protein
MPEIGGTADTDLELFLPQQLLASLCLTERAGATGLGGLL